MAANAVRSRVALGLGIVLFIGMIVYIGISQWQIQGERNDRQRADAHFKAKLAASTATCSSKNLAAKYVIAGGGTAGCVLARRLSEAGHSVILLENGENGDNDPNLSDPAKGGGLLNLFTNEYFQPFGHARQQSAPDDKRFPLPVGEVLGGGSRVNGMQYVRGTHGQFEAWAAYVGDAMWNAASALAHYVALEEFLGVAGHNNPGQHGGTGLYNVRQGTSDLAGAEAFRTAINGLGYPDALDHNDFGTPQGPFVYWHLSQKGTLRESTSTAYLGLGDYISEQSPGVYVSNNGNLRVFTNAQAIQVEFDSTSGTPRAIGVRVWMQRREHFVRSTHETILSMGSFGSALMLQNSGIGDETLLASLQIPLVHHNPLVGKQIHNHPTLSLEGLGPLPTGPLDANGLYAGGAMIRRAGNPDPTRRDFQMIWIPYGGGGGLVVSLFLSAKSQAVMEMKHNNPLRPFDCITNYLTDPDDVAAMVELYILEHNALTAMGLTVSVPASSKRFWSDPPPLPGDLAGVTAFVKATYGHAYHWVGACKMAPNEAEGVVDSNGRVFGVKSLRVADGSVLPINPEGNLAAPATLVGEIIAAKILAP